MENRKGKGTEEWVEGLTADQLESESPGNAARDHGVINNHVEKFKWKIMKTRHGGRSGD